jgi:hypothetical protein
MPLMLVIHRYVIDGLVAYATIKIVLPIKLIRAETNQIL